MGNTPSTADIDGLKMTNERLKAEYRKQAAELAKVKHDKLLLVNYVTENHMHVPQRETQSIALLEDQVRRLKLDNRRSTRFPEQGQDERCTQSTQTDLYDTFFSEENARIALQSRFYTPYIPYSPDITETWFTTLITRSQEAEPPGSSYMADIEMYNCQYGSSNMQTIISNKLARLQRYMYGCNMYFHATDAGSVKNILENGIDLTKSFRSVDFSYGKGFYVHDDFAKAVQWSSRVASWMNSKGAIIAFKITTDLQNEQPNLSLNENKNTDMKLWECIVSHFRHEARSPDVKNILRGVKFIKGPVANNRFLGSQEIPKRFPFTQMCICDDDYAKRFGSLQNISFVIFS